GHLSARLPARAGGGHGSRDHDRRHQSDDRHPLRLYRPPHPTDQIGARWRYRCKMAFVTEQIRAALAGAPPNVADRRRRWLRLTRELPLLPLAILLPFLLIALFPHFTPPHAPPDPIP